MARFDLTDQEWAVIAPLQACFRLHRMSRGSLNAQNFRALCIRRHANPLDDDRIAVPSPPSTYARSSAEWPTEPAPVFLRRSRLRPHECQKVAKERSLDHE